MSSVTGDGRPVTTLPCFRRKPATPVAALRPSLPPFLLSLFLSPLVLPCSSLEEACAEGGSSPAPSDSSASGRVWACAAPPRARLRVSLRVRTGGDPVRIQSQPRAGEGVSSRRGGAPFPTCILAALRPVLFAAAACERVRWWRRAGGRLGLPAALGVSREWRYCPPAPPSPLCSSGRQTVAWFAATWQKRRHSAVAATCWRCVSNPSVRSCE